MTDGQVLSRYRLLVTNSDGDTIAMARCSIPNDVRASQMLSRLFADVAANATSDVEALAETEGALQVTFRARHGQTIRERSVSRLRKSICTDDAGCLSVGTPMSDPLASFGSLSGPRPPHQLPGVRIVETRPRPPIFPVDPSCNPNYSWMYGNGCEPSMPNGSGGPTSGSSPTEMPT
jgi:hypothetical protein